LDIREIFAIFVVTKQTNETKIFPMISKDKVTEIFCIIDDFCKEYDAEIEKNSLKAPDGRKHRHRKGLMSDAEVMSILVYFHFNTFRNFKHYYMFFVKTHLADLFPNQLSYNRFVEVDDAVSSTVLLRRVYGHQFRRQHLCSGVPQQAHSSKAMPREERARWGGITVSSCI
jgi:hypothetical protein